MFLKKLKQGKNHNNKVWQGTILLYLAKNVLLKHLLIIIATHNRF